MHNQQWLTSTLSAHRGKSLTELRGPAHQLLAVRMRIIIIKTIIMVYGLIRNGAEYSASRQFFSTTALHLLR